jgi:hypothetical protein
MCEDKRRDDHNQTDLTVDICIGKPVCAVTRSLDFAIGASVAIF